MNRKLTAMLALLAAWEAPPAAAEPAARTIGIPSPVFQEVTVLDGERARRLRREDDGTGRFGPWHEMPAFRYREPNQSWITAQWPKTLTQEESRRLLGEAAFSALQAHRGVGVSQMYNLTGKPDYNPYDEQGGFAGGVYGTLEAGRGSFASWYARQHGAEEPAAPAQRPGRAELERRLEALERQRQEILRSLGEPER